MQLAHPPCVGLIPPTRNDIDLIHKPTAGTIKPNRKRTSSGILDFKYEPKFNLLEIESKGFRVALHFLLDYQKSKSGLGSSCGSSRSRSPIDNTPLSMSPHEVGHDGGSGSHHQGSEVDMNDLPEHRSSSSICSISDPTPVHLPDEQRIAITRTISTYGVSSTFEEMTYPSGTPINTKEGNTSTTTMQQNGVNTSPDGGHSNYNTYYNTSTQFQPGLYSGATQMINNLLKTSGAINKPHPEATSPNDCPPSIVTNAGNHSKQQELRLNWTSGGGTVKVHDSELQSRRTHHNGGTVRQSFSFDSRISMANHLVLLAQRAKLQTSSEMSSPTRKPDESDTGHYQHNVMIETPEKASSKLPHTQRDVSDSLMNNNFEHHQVFHSKHRSCHPACNRENCSMNCSMQQRRSESIPIEPDRPGTQHYIRSHSEPSMTYCGSPNRSPVPRNCIMETKTAPHMGHLQQSNANVPPLHCNGETMSESKLRNLNDQSISSPVTCNITQQDCLNPGYNVQLAGMDRVCSINQMQSGMKVTPLSQYQYIPGSSPKNNYYDSNLPVREDILLPSQPPKKVCRYDFQHLDSAPPNSDGKDDLQFCPQPSYPLEIGQNVSDMNSIYQKRSLQNMADSVMQANPESSNKHKAMTSVLEMKKPLDVDTPYNALQHSNGKGPVNPCNIFTNVVNTTKEPYSNLILPGENPADDNNDDLVFIMTKQQGHQDQGHNRGHDQYNHNNQGHQGHDQYHHNNQGHHQGYDQYNHNNQGHHQGYDQYNHNNPGNHQGYDQYNHNNQGHHQGHDQYNHNNQVHYQGHGEGHQGYSQINHLDHSLQGNHQHKDHHVKQSKVIPSPKNHEMINRVHSERHSHRQIAALLNSPPQPCRSRCTEVPNAIPTPEIGQQQVSDPRVGCVNDSYQLHQKTADDISGRLPAAKHDTLGIRHTVNTSSSSSSLPLRKRQETRMAFTMDEDLQTVMSNKSKSPNSYIDSHTLGTPHTNGLVSPGQRPVELQNNKLMSQNTQQEMVDYKGQSDMHVVESGEHLKCTCSHKDFTNVPENSFSHGQFGLNSHDSQNFLGSIAENHSVPATHPQCSTRDTGIQVSEHSSAVISQISQVANLPNVPDEAQGGCALDLSCKSR